MVSTAIRLRHAAVICPKSLKLFGNMQGGVTAAELFNQLLDLAAGAFGIDAGFSGAVQLQRDVREVKNAYAFLVGETARAVEGEAMLSDSLRFVL